MDANQLHLSLLDKFFLKELIRNCLSRCRNINVVFLAEIESLY